MSAPKLLNTWGVLGSTEASYAAGATLTGASHGLLVYERPKVELDFAHDGSRNGNHPIGRVGRVAKSGRTGKVAFTAEAMGPLLAYNGTTNIPSIHTFLRTCGHQVATVTTGGAEKMTYTPVDTGLPANMVSGAFEVYDMGQQWVLSGMYGSLGFSFEGPSVPAFNFEYQGLCAAPADVAIPSITYPNVAQNPAKAESLVLTMNAWAGAVVRSVNFSQGLTYSPRMNDNSTGHAGFSPGRPAPKLEVVVEAVALSTFNPYALEAAGTPIAVSFQVGSVQFNRWKLNVSQANIMVQEEEDGPTALWHLTLDLLSSSPTLVDYYSLVFD
jgi:hypothetical protein